MTPPTIQILVIEDSQVDALLLDEVLSRDPFNSFALTVVERLSAGLETLRKGRFDLVLLDLGLPDSQGLATFQNLHAEFPDIPVVILTGLMNERVALQAVQSGAQDYLVKDSKSWGLASRAIRYAIERQQMQANLRSSEARYRVLFENSPVSIWEQDFSQLKSHLDSLKAQGVTDLEQYFRDHPQALSACAHMIRILDVNHAGLKMYQAETKEDLIRETQGDLSPGEREHFLEVLVAIAQGKTSFGWEGTDETMTGETLAISLNGAVAPGYEEDFSRVIVTTVDITERKRAEKALRETNQMLQAIIKASPVGIVALGAEGTVKLWSLANEQIFGWSEAETLGKAIPYIQEDKREEHRLLRQRVLQGEAFMGVEAQRHRKDGTPVDISISTAPLHDGEGNIIGIMGVNTDITERKRVEQALRDSEARYRLATLATNDVIWEWDPSTRRLTWSENAQYTLGYPPEEIGPDDTWWDDHIHPEDRPCVIAKLNEVIQGSGTNWSEEYRFLLKDGSYACISDHAYIERDGNGNAIRMVGAMSDITERKRAEEALRRSNELLSLFIKQSPIYAYIKEVSPAESRVLVASENFKDMTGVPGSLMTGKTMAELFPPEFADKITADDFAVVAGGHVLKLDEELEGRNYTTIKFPILQGEKKLLAGYTMDITERKQAEEAIRNSERRYRSLFEDSPIALWEEDFSEVRHRLDGLRQAGVSDFRSYFKSNPRFVMECASLIKVLDVNKAAEELYKAENKEDLINNLSHILTSDTNMGFIEELAHIAEGHTKFSRAAINHTFQGDRLDINLTWSAAPGYEGSLSRVIVSLVDLTEMKSTEKALRESEEKYRLLFENAPVGVYRSTPQGRFLSVNPVMAAIYLYNSPEEMVTEVTNIARQVYVDPAHRQRFKHLLAGNGEVREFINQNYRRDGSLIWTSTNARVVKDDAGKVLYYEGFLTDVTSRVQAEETIRLSEKKFKTLFEIAPVGISVLDRDHNVIDTNYALQRITGMRKNELVNGAFRKRTYFRPDGSLMPPEEFASTRALKENMPIFDVETGIMTEDRGVVWTQISAAPLDMPGAGLVVITQDISERKLSEQTLHQRLAELEMLYESGLSLSQLLEPPKIGQKIIDVLADKLDWYHTTVRLYYPESDSLELLAYNIAGISSEPERQAVGERFKTLIARPGDGLSGWSLQHGETIRCGDVVRDPRYIETVPGLRSGLYVPIKTNGRATGVISVESEKPDYFTAEDEHLVATLAAQAAVALENIRLFADLQKSNADLSRAYDETIEGWSHALDLRDKETEGHTQRVAALTVELARAIGVSAAEIVHIRRGSLLHDIGKMGVPDRILLKPDKLTEEEWIIMRQHPVHAFKLLSKIDFLRPAIHIPHYHHERWNGCGYPEGRKGEQIPLEARIFAIVDVYDALTSDRPYRPAWPKDRAIQYIREQAGGYFDPQVVEAFLNLINRK